MRAGHDLLALSKPIAGIEELSREHIDRSSERALEDQVGHRFEVDEVSAADSREDVVWPEQLHRCS
jgi:hypothetical protein